MHHEGTAATEAGILFRISVRSVSRWCGFATDALVLQRERATRHRKPERAAQRALAHPPANQIEILECAPAAPAPRRPTGADRAIQIVGAGAVEQRVAHADRRERVRVAAAGRRQLEIAGALLG